MVTNYQTQWSFDQGQWIGLGTWFITTSETGIEAKFLQSLPHSQQAKFCPYMYSPNSLPRVIWRGTARAASMSNPISVIKLFSRSGPLDCHERKTIWKANTLCPPRKWERKSVEHLFITGVLVTWSLASMCCLGGYVNSKIGQICYQSLPRFLT